MLLTNHTLTGAAMGLNIPNAALLVPAAFISHLALDSLPHFSSRRYFGTFFDTTAARALGFLDCLGALSVYLLALHTFPGHWVFITIGVFFACLPDLFYLPQIFFGIMLDKGLRRLHSAVQWSQTEPGLIVEIAWAVAMIRLIKHIH